MEAAWGIVLGVTMSAFIIFAMGFLHNRVKAQPAVRARLTVRRENGRVIAVIEGDGEIVVDRNVNVTVIPPNGADQSCN